MPLELTEKQRRALSTRLMVQAPRGLSASQIANVRRDMDRVVNGLPGDVFMALDMLRLLADQGNVLAADLFDQEVEKLGLTKKFTSFRRG